MGHMVVEMKVVIDDGMGGVVELQQMLECSSSLLVLSFDIVDVD